MGAEHTTDRWKVCYMLNGTAYQERLNIGCDLFYIVAGIYIPEMYALPFAGSSVPWGVALGYLLIALSIVLSVIYVRAINKLESVLIDEHESDR